jgi:hypothetical protein
VAIDSDDRELPDPQCAIAFTLRSISNAPSVSALKFKITSFRHLRSFVRQSGYAHILHQYIFTIDRVRVRSRW